MTRLFTAPLAALTLGALALAATSCAAAAPRSADAAPCAFADAARRAACVEAAVTAVLAAQQAAWNRGDIPGFMDHYWKSDDLRFASGGDVTRGWAATLARYLSRYDSAEKMGRLSFDIVDIDVVGDDAALVFGAWRLARAADEPHGLFTLTFKRLDGAWVIVADHTSSAD